ARVQVGTGGPSSQGNAGKFQGGGPSSQVASFSGAGSKPVGSSLQGGGLHGAMPGSRNAVFNPHLASSAGTFRAIQVHPAQPAELPPWYTDVQISSVQLHIVDDCQNPSDGMLRALVATTGVEICSPRLIWSFEAAGPHDLKQPRPVSLLESAAYP